MATERRTVLTQVNPRTAPLESVRTNATGAYGDASGMVRFGEGLASLGQSAGRIDAIRQAEQEKKKAEIDRRDSLDLKARVQRASGEFQLKSRELVMELEAQGLRGENLSKVLEERLAQEFPKFQGLIAQMRDRNAELYDNNITEEVLGQIWEEIANGSRLAVAHINERHASDDRFTDTMERIRSLAGNAPSSAAFLSDLKAKVMPEIADGTRYSLERQASLQRFSGNMAYQLLSRDAAQRVDGTLELARQAQKAGLIEPREFDAIVGELFKKPSVETLTAPWKQLVTEVDSGHLIDPGTMTDAALSAVHAYDNENARATKVYQPMVLAIAQRNLRRAALTGAAVKGLGEAGGKISFMNGPTLLAEMMKPGSPVLEKWLDSLLNEGWDELDKSMPALSAEVGKMRKMSIDPDKRAQLRNELTNTVRMVVTDITEGRGNRVASLSWQPPSTDKPQELAADFVRHADSFYRSFGVPNDKRNYLLPAHEDYLNNISKFSSDQEFARVHGEVNAILDLYTGTQARVALLNFAKQKEGHPMRPILLAKAFGVDDRFAQSITSAVQFRSSQAAQELMKDPAVANEVRTMARAVVAPTGTFGTINPGFHRSPLMRAALQQGLNGAITEMMETLTLYHYAAAPTARNNAAAAATDALGIVQSIVLPVKRNGGNAENPQYDLMPVPSIMQDAFYRPFSENRFENYEALSTGLNRTLDSFFTDEPVKRRGLGSLGEAVDEMMFAFNSPTWGFGFDFGNAENLDASMVRFLREAKGFVREGKDVGFNVAPWGDDLSNLVVSVNTGETGTQLVPLTQTFDYVGLLKQDVGTAVKEAIGAAEDPSSITRRIIQQKGQWHYDPVNEEFRLRLPSDGAYMGNSGAYDSFGPAVDVLQMGKDGKAVPVTISKTEVLKRMNAIYARAALVNAPNATRENAKQFPHLRLERAKIEDNARRVWNYWATSPGAR